MLWWRIIWKTSSCKASIDRLKEYNKNKLDGLIPNYSKVGSKSKLTDEQFKELEAEITREDKHYTIKAVQKYINDKYSVE